MEIITQALVMDKNESKGKDRNGFDVTWYNVRLGDPDRCESQLIGVPEECYKKVVVGKVNRFSGSYGGLKTKWWKFDKWLGVVDK